MGSAHGATLSVAGSPRLEVSALDNGADGLRNRIPFLKSVAAIEKITEGYSDDDKYIVVGDDGAKSLLRVAPLGAFDRQQQQCLALQNLEILEVRAPRPLESGRLDDMGLCYCILTYIEGADATQALPRCPNQTQYEIGIQAGRDPLKMHGLGAPGTIPPWRERAMKKHLDYLDAYSACGVRLHNGEAIRDFIEANARYLDNRPNRFQHGDFHVGNIIVKDDRYSGAVDFDRHNWGDPFQEFMKVGFFSREVSVPFCLGQIHGYFGNRAAPDAFWRLYAVYVAMSVFSSLVWSLRSTPHEVGAMVERLSRVVDDHHGFRSTKPKWYGEP